MRAGVLAAVLMAACCLAQPLPAQFKPQHTYLYRFDTQIAHALQGSTEAEIQQSAVTRMRCQVRAVFTSDRHVQMQLEQCRIADSKGLHMEQQRMQPIEQFERQQLDELSAKKLAQPFEVEYIDGVVKSINFHEQDSTWSKNIKRAVVNQLQANLKQSDVQGLEFSAEQERSRKAAQENQDAAEAAFFTVPEINVEGQCQVTYTVQKQQGINGKKSEKAGITSFNATKSIDFERCQRQSAVSYGYRAQPQREQRCHQCLHKYTYESATAMDAARVNECQLECQSAQPNTERDVQRTSVQRMQLSGNPKQKFAVIRSETVSQYLVKAVNPDAQDAVARIVAITQLRLVEEKKEAKKLSVKPDNKQETLMWSAEWDVKEKRWYQYGDEEYPKPEQQPFGDVKNKQNKIINGLRHIHTQWEDKQLGYDLDTAQRFNDLVQTVRQCSIPELKSIEQALEKASESAEARDFMKSMFIDALATAATRNTLKQLVEKIQKEEVSDIKAAHILKTFSMNQHSPSDRQTDLLEKLAVQLEKEADRSPVLKQTAWLKFSASVGMICQQKPTETSDALFRQPELCPESKKEQYKKTLIAKFNAAKKENNGIYERILALKCIGNAGLENTMPELEAVMKSKRQPTIVRIEAIDAMRRLRTSQSKQIQRQLLPVFLNQREQPEVRMAAFSMLMHTRPEKALLDQLTLPMLMERSQQVRQFVLSTMESLAKSPVRAEQQLAQQLRQTLKLVREVSANDRKPYGRQSAAIRVPVYIGEVEQAEERDILARFASIVSPSNMLPIHLCASIRAAFNGEQAEDKLSIQLTQKNLEQWYDKLAAIANEDEEDPKESTLSKKLNNLYQSLGIKSRRSGSYFVSGEEDEEENASDNNKQGQRDQPYGMIVIRNNEVDQWILPVEEKSLPDMIQQILQGKRPSLSKLMSWLEKNTDKKHNFQQHIGTTFSEKKTKLPTSAGLPLTIQWDTTGLGSAKGHFVVKREQQSVRFVAQLSGIIANNLRTESWSPATASGVESVRILEITTPVDMELKKEKQGEYAAMMRVPTHAADSSEESLRLLGIHTLPFTYARNFDAKDKTYKQMRLQSVHNKALQPMLKDWHAAQQHGHALRFDGQLHIVKDAAQLLRAIYTAENNMHVYFRPQPNTPEHIIVRVQAKSFERMEGMSAAELSDFYNSVQNKNQHGMDSYEDEDDEELASMRLDKDEQRAQKLNAYVKKFNPKNAYRHQLKLSAEAKCGAKLHKMETTIGAKCDSQLKYCSVQVDAKRTPLRQETSDWTMQSVAHVLMPEIVRADEKPSDKHSRILAKLDAQWGNQGQKQQSVNVRVQAEPTRTAPWEQDNSEEEEYEQVNGKDAEKKAYSEWSRRLNKFDLVADYQLSQASKQAVQRVYELVKASYYYQLQQQPAKHNQNEIRATFVVDPITRRYANLTVRTPEEKLRWESIVLPARIGYELNRRPVNIHSAQQLVEHLSVRPQAECRADDRRVRTFAGVSYKAPMGGCWSVLAKDCSRQEPRFVVLMKKAENGEQRVRIQTPERVIDLINQQGDSDKPTRVEVDERKVEDEEELRELGIARLSDSTLHCSVRAISVRFNGEQARVKVSGLYKNLQCGLCGHFNDEDEDVFRMGNNKRAPTLKDFHQSYTLKNTECKEDAYKRMYAEDKSEQFELEQAQSGEKSDFFDSGSASASDEEFYGKKQQKKQSKYGYADSEEDEDDFFNSNENDESSEESDEQKKTEKSKPVPRTVRHETHGKLCFSIKPVPQCPRGYTVDQSAETKRQTIGFGCLDRADRRAHKMSEQLRRGAQQLRSAGKLEKSANIDIEVPTKCIKA